jgi:hypothetical protein
MLGQHAGKVYSGCGFAHPALDIIQGNFFQGINLIIKQIACILFFCYNHENRAFQGCYCLGLCFWQLGYQPQLIGRCKTTTYPHWAIKATRAGQGGSGQAYPKPRKKVLLRDNEWGCLFSFAVTEATCKRLQVDIVAKPLIR